VDDQDVLNFLGSFAGCFNHQTANANLGDQWIRWETASGQILSMDTLDVEDAVHDLIGLAHISLAARKDSNTEQWLIFTQSSVDTRNGDVSE
jgi:hypothetical protein